MGRCDVPEARKGAGDKDSPLERRTKERGGRKATPFPPPPPFPPPSLSLRFFIRQLLEVARKKRAKYPPLNAESTRRGFLTRKKGSNGGEEIEREREKKRGGWRERERRGGSWPRDRRPIHRAAAPRPAFRDIKGRHGSTCIGARRDVGVVDIRAVNLACTRCPRNKSPAILSFKRKFIAISAESDGRNGRVETPSSKLGLMSIIFYVIP